MPNNITQEAVDNSLLSKVVYDDQNAPANLNGYTRLGSSVELGVSTVSGYYGVAYKNNNSGEIYISHSGTTNELVDWTDNNIKFAIGGVPAQYDDAYAFTELVRGIEIQTNQNFELSDLNHTGHSLGGAIATLIGVSTDANQVYSYNSPGMGGNPLTYLEIHNQVPLGTYTNADYSNINAYSLTEDIVSDIGTQIGNYETLNYTVLDILSIFANAANPFSTGSSGYLNTIAFMTEMTAYLQAHSIDNLSGLLENELNNTTISDETIADFLQRFADDFNTTVQNAEAALTAILSESLKLSNSHYVFVNGFALDDLVASYKDPQGNTLSTTDFLNLTQNQTFVDSSISYQYQDYNNGAGQIIIAERSGSRVYFPADNDAEYSIQINHLDPANDIDPTQIHYSDYWGDLLVDISGSSQTAGVALSEVPLKPENLPPKATVDDGTTQTEYTGYGLDAEDAINELSGGMTQLPIAKVQTTEGEVRFSYVENDSATDIDGENYLITNVLDSISEAGTAVAEFVQSYVGSSTEWFTSGDLLNVTISGWFANNLGDLIDGNVDLDDAFIDLAEHVAQTHTANFVVGSILNVTGAYEALDTAMGTHTGKYTIEEGTGITEYVPSRFSGATFEALSRMAVDFALNSEGWDSTQYTNAGITTLVSVFGAEYAQDILGSMGITAGATAAGGAAAAATTIVATLINDHNLNSSEWTMLGLQAGIAGGSYIGGQAAGAAIASFFNIAGAATGVGIVAGAVIGLIASEIVSSLYKGKKFYEGEFGDKGVLLDSIYDIQDLEVDDGMGGTTTVQALVATNANGSTILLQEHSGITYAFGSSGADILVGDDSGDVMSGGDGNDYIEGKEGDENISGGNGNDHLIGAEGDDVIQGDAGDDIIFGDAGEDTILGGDGQDFIHGGSGADTISGGLERDTILASGGDDVVQGAEGDDMIDGGYGDDLLDGGEGDDLLLGNLGNDSITAGDGDDKVFGDVGNDTIMGGAGNDYINGGEGVDILQGDNGADLIYGDAGDDYLQGDLGDDDLGGGAGEDTILGGLDDDYIWGQAGADDLDGGLGDDFLRGGGADDALAGGAGNDVYILEANDSGGYGNDSIADSEGANDRIYINGLNSGNLSDLTMTRDGDNLTISYNAVLIGTVIDHFVAGDANAIERLEFDGDQYVDLSTITVDGGTGAVTYSAATDATQTTSVDIDAREDSIDANLAQQSQFWNNAFLQNLSEMAYEEALRDQFETELYNGSEINEYKRSRGKFGGHYKVYKLDSSTVLEGENPDIVSYTLLETGYDPTDYDEVVSGEVSNLDMVRYVSSANQYNIKYDIEDFFINGEVVGTQVNEMRLNTPNNYSSGYYVYSTDQKESEFVPIDYILLQSGDWSSYHIYAYEALERKAEGVVTNVQFGKDFLQQSGADHLVGSWWDEVINGGSGDDALFGGDGDDVVNGDGGDDWLFGGDGDDTIDGGTGDDAIFGGDGEDDITGGDGADAIFGGDGDDYISGGDGADWIDAGDGADIIIGGAGDDIIYAGGGDDYAEGGEGLDVIYGQGGNDTIYGNEGIDWLYGESGDDKIVGVHDEDHLYGGIGNDILSYELSTAGVVISLLAGTASGGYAEGDTFHDFEYIEGSDHADTLTGDNGVNKIWGLDGADTINGLGGNDYLWGSLDGDTIDGGDDEDYISYYSFTGGVEINMNSQWVKGIDTNAGHVQDNFLNIENAYGSIGDDIINGDSNNNRLYGWEGDDVISGGAGNDRLYGHKDGAHELKGNVGADLLYGGLDGDILNGGNDTDAISYYYNEDQGVTVSLINGTVDGNGTGGTQDTLISIENVYGSNFDDVITGDANGNRLYGYDGDDTLDGGDGDDYLFGYYAGAHTMIGGEGDDFFYAGLDGDSAAGGNGVDSISYYYSDVGVLVKTGQDFAENIAGGGVQDTFTSIENAYGSSFDDELNGDGNTNYLYGNDGDDTLKGGGGDDFLRGEDGDDTIYGHSGDDIIYGDAGDDVISGGGGNDTVSYHESTDNLIIDLSGSLASGTSIGLDFISSIESVLGGSGDDTITGSTNADTLDGYLGDDTINGGAGDDILYGNAGEDYIYGGNDDDTLNGGSDTDYLFGDAGDDILNGDSGSDILYGGVGSDTLNGGTGSDYASFKFSNAGVNVDLSTNTLSGGDAAGDTLISIEKLQGSDFDDTLTGDNVNNYLVGRDGDDTLNGMEGSDSLWGENGNDVFVFSDLTHSTDTAQDTIKDFAQGTDLIDLTAFTFTAITDFSITNVGGQTIVDDNSSTFSFVLDGTYTLADSDFIFV